MEHGDISTLKQIREKAIYLSLVIKNKQTKIADFFKKC